MACHLNDNVYIHTFTPREYQVELLDTAKRANTVVCSSTSNAKAFIAVKLLQEFAQETRKTGGRRALFVLGAQNVPIMTSHIQLLTDLTVCNLAQEVFDADEWQVLLLENSVIVTTAMVCGDMLDVGLMELKQFNLIVIDDCLYGKRQSYIENLMASYGEIGEVSKPRILGLAAGLLGPELQPVRLEAELQRLETLLCSSVDTSSELVTLLRLCCKPKERLVEFEISRMRDFENELLEQALDVRAFLEDHRYDPSEIYSDMFEEELRDIPDPKKQPLELVNDFIDILTELGGYAADLAALNTLYQIEKLKVKTPYERHYLLLCVVSTVMVKIRAMCDHAMRDYTEKERIMQFSTPKVLRFLEIIRQFKPPIERPTETATAETTTTPTEQSPVENVTEQASKTAKSKTPRTGRRSYMQRAAEEQLCALVFVRNRLTAKVIFSLLYHVSACDEDYWWVAPLYTVDKIADPCKEPKEAEIEHKRQEDVLRKYRSHECNIMVATFVLEQGCDLPKCNLVIRFDLPTSFHSYVQSKARARSSDAHYLLLVGENHVVSFVRELAEYIEVENTLLRRSYSLEPDKEEEIEADRYICEPYQPLPESGSANVNLGNSIPLINRYCVKLPSDTFTRLTPIWEVRKHDNRYVCSIRLPINSPVKQTVISPPVKNSLLARRVAAFMLCQLLHKSGELDDNLQPVGKENFQATEEDWNVFPLEEEDEELAKDNGEPRPGTTKRRQYYYKRIADALLDCHPKAGEVSYFYRVVMSLTCPIPEEQNTRGRRIYPPEESPQGFGILTSKKIPKICPFPIFTRSGEVCVDLELCSDNVVLDKNQIGMINEFLSYTFTSVLRLQKYLMLFDPEASESSYLIVPTYNNGRSIEIDWKFIDLIYEKRDIRPTIVPEEERASYHFDSEVYKDAVVMPWYRNQDQPQYFYVAEICTNLNPKSAFPGSEYATFEEYYLRKYGIQIKNDQQHLLDVDHTSARLNFLTPRYVNRKGVALPTSSEETKRAKRENLEQKQILVPELCAVHPFPSSLWRKAVCLPCILYRINALLIADQIRKTVATDLGLGTVDLPDEFKWPELNFGWSLSDVLKRNKQQQQDKQKATIIEEKPEPVEVVAAELALVKFEETVEEVEEIFDEEVERPKDWVEIGTWSNDMALDEGNGGQALVRYASPTSWMHSSSPYYDDYSMSEESSIISDDDSNSGGLKIAFTGDNQAEAVEDNKETKDFELCGISEAWGDDTDDFSKVSETLTNEFIQNCSINESLLMTSKILVRKDVPFQKTSSEEQENAEMFLDEIDDENIRNLTVELADDKQGTINELKPLVSFKRTEGFSFDEQPNLTLHPGPSPSVILQALTMSNANDGINLERLETIGDSFLKYAITTYLYCKYENIHEGKLSHLRSKQVSNLNLYRLGKKKALGDCMISTKFDPHDNWLPPCYCVPKELEEALLNARVPANYWSPADMAATRQMTLNEVCEMVREQGDKIEIPSIIPYNLVTQHSIPDKSIADCVEALIGSYLIDCGPRGALLFMAWLGIRVLPQLPDGNYGELEVPQSPLLRHVENPEETLDVLLDGYDRFEAAIGYNFRDRSYLLQALTHASYFPNTITDCYQRLEFLGDAVLDYLITRHLYEDTRMHSPGELTDLRSALVNNTIFASLAVRHGFHRYFRHLSPGLQEVIERFIRIQEESGHALVEEYLLAEYECEEVEDVEVPKALGDVFESVAGAIFLDSGMSLDAVWNVYYKMMQKEIEQFSDRVPKSPIRELLELEPETAKFGKPEKLADGRRVRVTVDVFGKGKFKGIGRNYRIAKCTAAKCALKYLKRRIMLNKRN